MRTHLLQCLISTYTLAGFGCVLTWNLSSCPGLYLICLPALFPGFQTVLWTVIFLETRGFPLTRTSANMVLSLNSGYTMVVHCSILGHKPLLDLLSYQKGRDKGLKILPCHHLDLTSLGPLLLFSFPSLSIEPKEFYPLYQSSLTSELTILLFSK